MNKHNTDLLYHLKQATIAASKSYYYSEVNPDDANPTFGNEVAQHLRNIYNALSTGWKDDDTYQDEIFK